MGQGGNLNKKVGLVEKTQAVIFPTMATFPALACSCMPGRVTSALQSLLGKGRDFSCLSPARTAKLLATAGNLLLPHPHTQHGDALVTPKKRAETPHCWCGENEAEAPSYTPLIFAPVFLHPLKNSHGSDITTSSTGPGKQQGQTPLPSEHLPKSPRNFL